MIYILIVLRGVEQHDGFGFVVVHGAEHTLERVEV
jgi:hypothetical protein